MSHNLDKIRINVPGHKAVVRTFLVTKMQMVLTFGQKECVLRAQQQQK